MQVTRLEQLLRRTPGEGATNEAEERLCGGVCKKLRDLLDAMVEWSQSLLIQKKKSSQAILNLPSLVPSLAIGMPTRKVGQIVPPF